MRVPGIGFSAIYVPFMDMTVFFFIFYYVRCDIKINVRFGNCKNQSGKKYTH